MEVATALPLSLEGARPSSAARRIRRARGTDRRPSARPAARRAPSRGRDRRSTGGCPPGAGSAPRSSRWRRRCSPASPTSNRCWTTSSRNQAGRRPAAAAPPAAAADHRHPEHARRRPTRSPWCATPRSIASLAREDSRAGQARVRTPARDLPRSASTSRRCRGGARLEELLDPRAWGFQGRPATQEGRGGARRRDRRHTCCGTGTDARDRNPPRRRPSRCPSDRRPAAAGAASTRPGGRGDAGRSSHPGEPLKPVRPRHPDLDFSPPRRTPRTPAAMPQAATEPIGTDARAPAAAPNSPPRSPPEAEDRPMAAEAAPVGARRSFRRTAGDLHPGRTRCSQDRGRARSTPRRHGRARATGHHPAQPTPSRVAGAWWALSSSATPRAVEQAPKRWLQLDWGAHPALFAPSSPEGHPAFSARVAQLEHGEAGGGDTAQL